MNLDREIKRYSINIADRYFMMLEMWPKTEKGMEADSADVAEILCQMEPEMSDAEAVSIVKELREGIADGQKVYDALAKRLDSREPIHRQVSAFLNQQNLDEAVRKRRLRDARQILLDELGRPGSLKETKDFMALSDEDQCRIVGELLEEYSYQMVSGMLQIARDEAYERSLGMQPGTVCFDDRLLALCVAIWLEDGKRKPIGNGGTIIDQIPEVAKLARVVKNAVESNAGEAFLMMVGGVSTIAMSMILCGPLATTTMTIAPALAAGGMLASIGGVLLLTVGIGALSLLMIGGIKLVEAGWNRWREGRRPAKEGSVIEAEFVDDQPNAPVGT